MHNNEICKAYINKNYQTFDCHLSNSNMSPTCDSTHQNDNHFIPNTGQHLHVNWFTSILNMNCHFMEILRPWGM